MKHLLAVVRWGIALCAALLLLGLPWGPRVVDEPSRWVVEGAFLVLLAGLVPRRSRRWTWLLALVWLFLLLFEGAMFGSRTATQEDMVLYDGFQLLWHLGVLSLDLNGWSWSLWALAGVLTGVVFALGVGRVAFSVLLDRSRVPAVLVGVLGLGTAVYMEPFSSSWLFGRRAVASVELLQRIQTFQRSDLHEPHVAVELTNKPDVRIYIIESYGMTAFERAPMAQRWRERIRLRATTLRNAGWRLAVTRSAAPTAGGRSWICDAAVLTGRQLRYQAEYQTITQAADELQHLPSWFARQGYRTILSRPSDRARPGVALQNRFRFEQTVFFDDLDYRGNPIGWGRIPDQYTVGWLHANRFADRSDPQFSFVHLATAHFPWTGTPPYREDWRDYNTRSERFIPRKGRHLDKNLWQLARSFRRGLDKEPSTGPGRGFSRHESFVYLETVDHGLKSIIDELVKIPADRPTLVVIMGDHQPVHLGRRGRMDVPVHFAANDPRLLDQLKRDGVIAHWQPGRTGRIDGIVHASLYSRIIRALADYDGSELPPLLPEGIPL